MQSGGNDSKVYKAKLFKRLRNTKFGAGVCLFCITRLNHGKTQFTKLRRGTC